MLYDKTRICHFTWYVSSWDLRSFGIPRCVKSQKSANLIYTVAQAWNHAYMYVWPYHITFDAVQFQHFIHSCITTSYLYRKIRQKCAALCYCSTHSTPSTWTITYCTAKNMKRQRHCSTSWESPYEQHKNKSTRSSSFRDNVWEPHASQTIRTNLLTLGLSRRRKSNSPHEAAGLNFFVFTAAIVSFKTGDESVRSHHLWTRSLAGSSWNKAFFDLKVK